MDKRPPTTKVGKGQRTVDAAGAPSDKETRVLHETATPEEHDPLWNEMGSTRVTAGKDDSSDDNLASSSDFTPMSPGRVLGKDIVALGDFKLIKKLGEGAMGAVYKAKQVSFNNRVVALKILFPHVANNKKLLDRFEREGKVMFELDHPNIISAYAIGDSEGCHYVAMEYVSGQSTQQWISQLGRMPVGDAVRITLDCAKALAYAHSQKLVHRDIKPDNILLTKRGVVKVADLGMVKVQDEEMSLTQTGHAVGTPWYMPLEQARNAKSIDGRSDIYALGCTFYAFLTGKPPFQGDTLVDVIRAKETGTFPPARQGNANVPERLDLILAKMTAKLPKNRYQSCEELIKDLESLELASQKLSFVGLKPGQGSADEGALMERTTAVDVSAVARGDSNEAVPVPDNDIWYVQMKHSDGKQVTRKYNTAQMRKMLEDGTISPNARVSHSPTEGFRSAATFREFQGTALTKATKKGADKHGAKYRQEYKKIEEEERKRDAKETAQKDDDAVRANMRYWVGIGLAVVPIAGAIIGAAYLIYYVARGLF